MMTAQKPDLMAVARTLLQQKLHGTTAPLFFHVDLTIEQQTHVRSKPRPYIEVALELLTMMRAQTIVEIGCMRQPMNHPLSAFDPRCCNDGHSTAFWASTGLTVHSVDIDPNACATAAQACAASRNVTITNEDGLAFLDRFDGRIDLLYLDAWDVAPGSPYAEKHLEAWHAARPKMNPTSLVMIDDTDILFGGKGRLLISSAIRDGYDLVVMGRQTMLLRT